MAELLAPHVRRAPTTEALVDEVRSMTWTDLNARVNQLIDALAQRGVASGSYLAVISTNRTELFEVILAGLHAGITIVPINWHWTSTEIGHVLLDSAVDAVITEDEFAPAVVDACVEAKFVPRVFVRIGGSPQGRHGDDYEAFLQTGDSREPARQESGRPMFYTSGTTGQPKGVRSTNSYAEIAGLGRFVDAFCSLVGTDVQSRLLLAGPAYHSAQWMFSVLPLLGGARLRIAQRVEPEVLLATAAADRITHVNLVPTQMVRLLRLPAEIRQAFDASGLQRAWHGGASCSRDVKRRMIEWWGPKLWEYYGGTEAGFVSFIESDDWIAHPGSVGRPVEAIEVAVRSEEGSDLDAGCVGQVWFRSRIGRDFTYQNDAAKTAAAHAADGFATLGDVGYLDGGGWLYLTDRKIDMIVSGGVNIYPAEVEAALLAHSAVADVAVIGIPDDEYGESVLAIVEPAEFPARFSLETQLATHCRTLLAGYKCPRAFEFRPTLGRLPTGKLNKRDLREPYWQHAARSI